MAQWRPEARQHTDGDYRSADARGSNRGLIVTFDFRSIDRKISAVASPEKKNRATFPENGHMRAYDWRLHADPPGIFRDDIRAGQRACATDR